jgi:CRP-like cAMP-binding protein
MTQIRSRNDDKRAMLGQLDLFSTCTKAELSQVSALTSEISARAGQTLTRQGGHGLEFFVVVEGTATARRGDTVLTTLGPGAFFGELAILDHGQRTATVTADTDMTLLVFTRGEFSGLLRTVPVVAPKIIDELAARLRTTDEILDPQPAS